MLVQFAGLIRVLYEFVFFSSSYIQYNICVDLRTDIIFSMCVCMDPFVIHDSLTFHSNHAIRIINNANTYYKLSCLVSVHQNNLLLLIIILVRRSEVKPRKNTERAAVLQSEICPHYYYAHTYSKSYQCQYYKVKLKSNRDTI